MPVTTWVATVGVASAMWLLVPASGRDVDLRWWVRELSRSPSAPAATPRSLSSSMTARRDPEGAGSPGDRDARAFGAGWRPAAPWRPGLVVAVLVGGLVALLDGTVLALAAIGLVGSLGAGRVALRARAARGAWRRADSVVEVCEALAGELKAGQPPVRALRHCVEVWPEIEPVAAAADLGADVPRGLRRLAALPGASGLADLASAWQVSESSGGTVAVALARVAGSARRRRETQQVVAAELASARATARLVALLPVAVLAMGSGLGGDPWAFLFSTPVGLVCLGAGVALVLAGLAWIERLATTAAAP